MKTKTLLSFTALIIFLSLMVNTALAQSTNTFPPTGSAGIGTTTPNSSSILEMVSTSKGVLVPRMNKSQRDAIIVPATGLLIYQTNNTPGFYYFDGSGWVSMIPKSANKTLGNLTAPTAVNVELLPGVDNSINLGSVAKSWKDIYLDGKVYINGNAFMSSPPSGNTFVGELAGLANTTGKNDCFFGFSSGTANTTGGTNVFVGQSAGSSNVSSSDNTFVGASSGLLETQKGNTFIGKSCGASNTDGTLNTCIGDAADISGSGITNATSIGNGAVISASNSFVFGNAAVAQWGFGINTSVGDIIDFANTTAKLTNGGVWTNASDKKLKENFVQLDKKNILSKVNQLDITQWNYIADQNDAKHIGPMAQDFYRLFGTGDDTTISTIDPSGVALVAIQQLTANNVALQASVDELKSENKVLAERIEKIESMMQQPNSSPAEMQDKQFHSQTIELSGSEARIEQNIPNPFNQTTTIDYFIPESAGAAQINFYSEKGDLLKSAIVNEKGAGKIELKVNEVNAGIYNYSLVIDGKVMGTRQMVNSK